MLAWNFKYCHFESFLCISKRQTPDLSSSSSKTASRAIFTWAIVRSRSQPSHAGNNLRPYTDAHIHSQYGVTICTTPAIVPEWTHLSKGPYTSCIYVVEYWGHNINSFSNRVFIMALIESTKRHIALLYYRGLTALLYRNYFHTLSEQ